MFIHHYFLIYPILDIITHLSLREGNTLTICCLLFPLLNLATVKFTNLSSIWSKSHLGFIWPWVIIHTRVVLWWGPFMLHICPLFFGFIFECTYHYLFFTAPEGWYKISWYYSTPCQKHQISHYFLSLFFSEDNPAAANWLALIWTGHAGQASSGNCPWLLPYSGLPNYCILVAPKKGHSTGNTKFLKTIEAILRADWRLACLQNSR